MAAATANPLKQEYYFPKGESVLRMVMDHHVVGLLYGSRGLVVGALEPMAFTGTYLRSNASKTGDYYGRLLKTQQAFEDVFFKPKSEADKTLKRVAKLHSRVNGIVEESVGVDYPKGSTYDAHDPWLSFWTMAVLCESAYAVYRAYVRELTDHEKELYWKDWQYFGELFGMPEGAAPDTWNEFRSVYFEYIHSDRPNVIPMANRAAIASVNLPVGGPGVVLNRTLYLLLAATLPARVRELHNMPWGIPEQLAWGALNEAVKVGQFLIPASFKKGPVAEFAKSRVEPLRDKEARIIKELQGRLSSPA